MSKNGGYTGPLEQVGPCQWRIPKSYRADMRVDGLIFADETLIEQIKKDQGPEQVVNVATLAGHPEGQSGDARHPLGLRLRHRRRRRDRPRGGGRHLARRRRLRHQLRRPSAPLRTWTGTTSSRRSARSSTSSSATSPRASASRASTSSTSRSSSSLMEQGSAYVVEPGLGNAPRPRSSPRPAASSTAPTPTASAIAPITRGYDQCGTLGSGNHFLEVQVVDRVHRRDGRAGDGPARGPDHRADPLRLARAGLPGLRRLPRRLQGCPEEIRVRACPTGSSPALRCGAPRANRTSARCARRPTTPGATASCSTHQAREVFAPGLRADPGKTWAWTWCTTSPTTSPSSRTTTSAAAVASRSASTARGRPAPSRRAIPRSPRPIEASASR